MTSLYIDLNQVTRGQNLISKVSNIDSFSRNLSLFIITKSKYPEKSAYYFKDACNSNPNHKSLLLNLLPIYNKVNAPIDIYSDIYDELISNHSDSLILSILYCNYMIKINQYDKALSIANNFYKIKNKDNSLYPILINTMICAGCNNETIEKILPKGNINNIIYDSNIIELHPNYYINKESIKKAYSRISLNNKHLKKITLNNIYPSVATNSENNNYHNKKLINFLKIIQNMKK
ncbi:hypothetical protein [Piscirickettsia litoralis]|uniref:Uncharacterized protein n=1 Tax=Piscirickettsia litoralis TaxID=1891921 RepID=A0ABX3A4F5_9GAMM|nr:hypothetical protein [Piscirickettsia litoralis]ODN43752.1 hypothetical protein BGC07_13665 [Piscirickettsia litoralis]